VQVQVGDHGVVAALDTHHDWRLASPAQAAPPFGFYGPGPVAWSNRKFQSLSATASQTFSSASACSWWLQLSPSMIYLHLACFAVLWLCFCLDFGSLLSVQ
jgi:hypothetical protein